MGVVGVQPLTKEQETGVPTTPMQTLQLLLVLSVVLAGGLDVFDGLEVVIGLLVDVVVPLPEPSPLSSSGGSP